MYQIFISHDHRDAEAATRLRTRILDVRPSWRVFLSSHADSGPQAGASWRSWIRNTLGSSDLMLHVAGSHETSAWCNAEIGIALHTGLSIVPISIGPEAYASPLLSEIQAVSIDRPVESLLGIVIETDSPGPASLMMVGDDANPYAGLEPLDASREAFLSGRDEDVASLTADFARMGPDRPRTVIISGPSGSGKSSLVRAGIIPALTRLGWGIIGPVRPSELIDWRFDRINSRNHLASTVIWPRVLVVDQVEELLLLPEQERTHVQAELGEAAANRCALLFTIRSEFRHHLDTFVGHPIDHYLPPIAVADLYEVIRRPARWTQLHIDEQLVDRLVLETESGNALALLAFTLSELWERRDRQHNALIEAELDKLGGVAGVLSGRADEALRQASDGDNKKQGDVLRLLSRLASPNHIPPTRDPMRVARVDSGERARLDWFVDAGLLIYRTAATTGGRVAQPDGDELIDVAHESLFSWPPLARAIDQERQANIVHASIEETATAWDRGGRIEDELLLAGSRLEFAIAELPTTSEPLMRSYVRRSLKRDRSRRRRRALGVGVVILGCLAAGLGLVANSQRLRAEQSEQRSQAIGIAAQANELVSDERDLALLAGALSLQLDANPLTEGALRNALTNPRGPLHYFSEQGVDWSTLQAVSPTVGVAVAGGRVLAVDLVTGMSTPVGPLQGVEIVDLAPGMVQGDVVVRGRRPPSQWVVAVVNLDGSVIHTVEHPSEITVAVADGQSSIIFGDFDGGLHYAKRSVDVDVVKSLDQVSPFEVSDIAITADGSWLAVAALTGIVVYRATDNGFERFQELTTSDPGAPSPQVLSFRGDGSAELMASGTDPTVRRWHLANDGEFEETTPLGQHPSVVETMTVTASGETLYTGGQGGAILAWDLTAGSLTGEPLLSHRGDVLAMSTLGESGLVTTELGTAIVWDLASARTVERLDSVPESWSKETLVAMVEGRGPLAAVTLDGRLLVAEAGDLDLPPQVSRAWWAGDQVIVRTGSRRPTDPGPATLWSIDPDGTATRIGEGQAMAMASCLAAFADETTVRFVDVGDCERTTARSISLDGMSQPTASVPAVLSISPDEQRILIVLANGSRSVLGVSDPSLDLALPPGPKVGATSATWLDDVTFAIGHDRGAPIQIIDLSDDDVEIIELNVHQDAVRHLVFDAVLGRLYSAGEDGVIQLTDIDEQLTVGRGLSAVSSRGQNDQLAEVRSLTLSEDGTVLYSIQNFSVSGWELDLQNLVAMACSRASRPLQITDAQRLGLDEAPKVCE